MLYRLSYPAERVVRLYGPVRSKSIRFSAAVPPIFADAAAEKWNLPFPT